MTDAEIDALEVGKELDRLVDEAIGGFGNGHRFRPSFDWNDAMWAAEKVGLFGTMGYSLEPSVDGWMVVGTVFDKPTLACDDSGPVAICRAILKAVNNAST